MAVFFYIRAIYILIKMNYQAATRTEATLADLKAKLNTFLDNKAFSQIISITPFIDGAQYSALIIFVTD
jgi:hypothetical protein